MSSVGNSPDRMGVQSLYSLRWNNHQAHIQQFFQELLHEENLVDVTLICAETSVKAHKVVLSACSPFFQRIFAENPCKHPVIVLKDFSNHELSTLIDFMYGGEVKIAQEELPGLMRAAECLQVRGLSSSEPRLVSEEPRPSSSSSTLLEFTTPDDARHGTPEEDDNALENTKEIKPTLFQQTRDHPTKPLIGHMNFGIRESCGSPLMPRRKQARPRRRSGELLPQDLSRRPTPPASLSPLPSVLNLSGNQHQAQQQQQQLQLQQPQYSQQMINRNNQQQMINAQQNSQHQQQQEDMAENLSMKKSMSPSGLEQHRVKTEGSEATSSPRGSPLTGTSLMHPDGSIQDIPAAAVAAAVATVIPSMSLTQTQPSEYLTSLGHLASQWLPGQTSLPPPPPQGHHPREDSPHGSGRPHHAYQQQQQQEPSIVPRRNSLSMFTPLDGVTLGGGLFPHTGYDRTVLASDSFLADSFNHETLQNIFSAPNLGPPPKKTKKHRSDSDGTSQRRWSDHNSRTMAVNRPKGQHSAPRGGPPRSWTNSELTLALTHVWEKKLTTSQASRMFGIPYNSLLMYVRGKYGKSLKLEQLRRNCTGTNTPEIMNNNNIKPVQQSPQMSHALASLSLQHPGDNSGFASHRSLISGNMTQPQGFYAPDYAAAPYPLAVNMMHMLPPSEQKTFESSVNSSGDGIGCPGGGGDGNGDGDLTNSQTSETPSPIVDHHHHHQESSSSSSSMQPQPTQSAPALLQQNGSD
ncbi:protein jim lovell [Formica exsecta]|uniref:protein jim lovell n=1 Tax=Formica exsecta TaxID=72781 RepID=UPI0011414F1E|nr:protein jim lovell [Formica exsecta]XP_029673867.1 protein jim lovell [Formica exsecta]XP_029673868.1 protein jim lovell [Formica exsecta]